MTVFHLMVSISGQLQTTFTSASYNRTVQTAHLPTLAICHHHVQAHRVRLRNHRHPRRRRCPRPPLARRPRPRPRPRPSKNATAMVSLGAKLWPGDYSNDAALRSALSGCSAIFLNLSPDFTDPGVVLYLAQGHHGRRQGRGRESTRLFQRPLRQRPRAADALEFAGLHGPRSSPSRPSSVRSVPPASPAGPFCGPATSWLTTLTPCEDVYRPRRARPLARPAIGRHTHHRQLCDRGLLQPREIPRARGRDRGRAHRSESAHAEAVEAVGRGGTGPAGRVHVGQGGGRTEEDESIPWPGRS
ncbi:hypothetical protein TOPH_05563 [Tolypocladium ophioglossoides CBS 100239]|uniref:Uncharacterized protein n=1 Tax=Tolypocladium ophioglossoides (strain CBS 100239) TaxID=1163406 RepID=A0A0L0N707_TOLOC|nr:hypothetical protein TOPH_05563 [Tolypocladium ophioglossoides CBS 100239]